MKKTSKSLLHLEYLDESDKNIINRLCKIKKKKPDFSQPLVSSSNLFSRVKSFLPIFQKDTDEILNDETKR